MKKYHFLWMMTIILLLAACAPDSPLPVGEGLGVRGETVTPTPVPTTTATALPTSTPTPTPLPATPEYDGPLTYDPANKTLYNEGATPVFALDENGAWVGVLPERVESVVGQMEMAYGEVSYEAVEVGGEQVTLVAAASGEWVYVREDGSMFVELGGEGFEINSVGEFEGESRAYYPGQQEGGERWRVWNAREKEWREVAFSGFDWENFQRPIVEKFLVDFGFVTEAELSGLSEEELDEVLGEGLEEVGGKFLEKREEERIKGMGKRWIGVRGYGDACESDELDTCYTRIYIDGVVIGGGSVLLERGAEYGGEVGGVEYRDVSSEGDGIGIFLVYNPESGLWPIVVGAELESMWVQYSRNFQIVFPYNERVEFGGLDEFTERVNEAEYSPRGRMMYIAGVVTWHRDPESWDLGDMLTYGNSGNKSIDVGSKFVNSRFFPFIADESFGPLVMSGSDWVNYGEMNLAGQLEFVKGSYNSNSFGVFTDFVRIAMPVVE